MAKVKQTNKQTDKQTGQKQYAPPRSYLGGIKIERTNRQTNGQTNGQTDKRMDRRSDYIMPQILFWGIKKPCKLDKGLKGASATIWIQQKHAPSACLVPQYGVVQDLGLLYLQCL